MSGLLYERLARPALTLTRMVALGTAAGSPRGSLAQLRIADGDASVSPIC